MSQIHQGQCLQCGGANLYTSVTCNRCHAKLPWADALSQSALSQSALSQDTLNHIGQPTNKLSPYSQSLEPHRPIQAVPVQLPLAPASPARLPLDEHHYCTYCGTAHIVEASYCSGCGQPVAAPPSQNFLRPLPLFIQNRLGTAPATRQQSMRQPPVPVAQPPTVNVSVVTTQQNSDSHGFWAWLVGLFMFFFKFSVVVAFIAGALAVISSM